MMLGSRNAHLWIEQKEWDRNGISTYNFQRVNEVRQNYLLGHFIVVAVHVDLFKKSMLFVYNADIFFPVCC